MLMMDEHRRQQHQRIISSADAECIDMGRVRAADDDWLRCGNMICLVVSSSSLLLNHIYLASAVYIYSISLLACMRC